MEAHTASLRSAAPSWSLAGDKQLLEALQCLQQRIVTKCQETNRRLEEMVTALDDASVNLHNVNNRFMALSNSQFVESRVYDDDDVTAPLPPPKEPPKPVDQATELNKLKLSLKVLESMHTAVTILRDSDTDSDDDDDVVSAVLKPKDMYADRPLPHIIGSQAWKSKWHAGLIREDSDSDSSECERVNSEQYSDSEISEDVDEELQHERHDATISTSSSELIKAPQQRVEPTPSDIAAELARRLGGAAVMPPREPEQSHPEPTVRKVYKPERPTAGIVFSDEPPPLDESNTDNEEDDIFAELHKSKPYVHNDKSDVTDELFGADLFSKHDSYVDDGDIFGVPDVPVHKASTPASKPKSTLFEGESEPEMFVQKPSEAPAVNEEVPTKKPIGGISLFGTNKNADSIGAAILKRNRKQSISSEESGSDVEPKPQIRQETKQKDIFDDLFAKSEKLQKKNAKEEDFVKEKIPEKVVQKERKVDLFSDNLFEDVDDLFSTNIVSKIPIKEPNKNQKSLFDDDDDDLFADIAITKPKEKTVTKSEKKIVTKDNTKTSNSKSIFDSDDDIFTDREISAKSKKYPVMGSKTENLVTKKTKGLFEDSDDDLFTNTDKTTKGTNISKSSNNDTGILKDTKIETVGSNNSLNQNVDKMKIQKNSEPIYSPSLFEDDDIDDLFANTNKVAAIGKIEEKLKHKDDTVKDIDKDQEIRNGKDSLGIQDEDLFSKSDQNNMAKNQDPGSQKSSERKKKSHENDVFDDENEDTDIFSRNESSKTINEAKVVKELPKIDDIFEDEWEEDLFTNKTTSDTKEKPSISQTPSLKINQKQNIEEQPQESQSVFEDKETDQDLFSSKPVQKSIRSEIDLTVTDIENAKNDIFGDNVDGGGLFHINVTKSTSSTNESKAKEKPILSQKPVVSMKIPKPEKTNIEEENRLVNKDREEEFQSNLKQLKPDTSQRQPEKPKPTENPNIHKIFQTNDFEDDIFNTNIEQNTTQKLDIQTNEIPQTTQSKLNKLDNMKDLDDNKNVTESQKTDLFTDIFNDQPPLFEKPKEPKKSKNINALFDDDSDDEALFFKKNDLLEEKPDLSPKIADRFGIFVDEPPAMDFEDTIDYKTSENADEAMNLKLDQESKNDNPKNISHFSDIPEKSFNKNTIDNVNKTKNSADSALNKKEQKPIDNVDAATKKIGKLKPMNLNINVNTLLPGASPKKHKNEEQISNSQEELHTKEKAEEVDSKLVKSVSFEGDPESAILDNTLSKDRPKIQVRRRPSTRRARREAVKKSGIDFGEDSTDNSSSIDDVPRQNSSGNIDDKIKSSLQTDSLPFDDIIVGKDHSESTENAHSIESSNQTHINSKVIVNDINREITILKSVNESKDINIESSFKNDGTEISNKDILDPNIESSSKTSPNKNVKSKIVYILNDEDIFNTKKDDIENDLFPKATEEQSKGISTLGKVYPDSNQTKSFDKTEIFEDTPYNIENNQIVVEKTTASISKTKLEKPKNPLFDDLSDEELFGKKPGVTKKQTIFDSDSDNELFGKDTQKSKNFPKQKDTENPLESKREMEERSGSKEIKHSLFSDDDDDDLFGVKTNKVVEPKPQPKAKEHTTEPVYEDPLSLFGNQDD